MCEDLIRLSVPVTKQNTHTMQTFTDADFIGRTLYVSTNPRQVARGLIPVCIHIVQNKKKLQDVLKEIELDGETVASMVWGR